jgi:hypothetical protein
LTWEISGDSVAAVLPDWLLRTTMTGDADLVAPLGGDVAEVAALAVTAPVRTHARDAPAAMPMTGLDLLIVPSAATRVKKAQNAQSESIQLNPP